MQDHPGVDAEMGGPNTPEGILWLLNWISYCLVTQARGQSVACALVKDTHAKSMTFLLASSTRLGPADLSFADRFLSQVVDILRGGAVLPAVKDDLLKLLASGSMPHMHRKAQLINVIHDFYHRSPPVTAVDILKMAVGDDDPAVPIIAKIVELTDSLLVGDGYLAMRRILTLAQEFLLQPSIAEIDQYDAKENIVRLRRRVEKLAFYLRGADHLLALTTSILKLEDASSYTFNHKWLPYVCPITIDTENSWKSLAIPYIEEAGYVYSDAVFSRAFPQSTSPWEPGASIDLSVHPEARLVTHFKSMSTSREPPVYPVERSIGCSKRACYACADAFYEWTPGRKGWKVSAPSRKPVVGWKVPENAEMYIRNWLDESSACLKDYVVTGYRALGLGEQLSPLPSDGEEALDLDWDEHMLDWEGKDW